MIETLWAALAEVPGAVLVIVFLGGPTAAWIIFRVLNASARQRPGSTMTGLMWVCAACRSANDGSRDRCYRCGVAANVDALEVIEPETALPGLRPVMTPGLDLGGRAPVAVGPGKTSTGPEPVPEPVPVAVAVPAPVSARVGTPQPVTPRRAGTAAAGPVKPKGRAGAAGVAKPQGAAAGSKAAGSKAAKPKSRAAAAGPARPKVRAAAPTGGDGTADGQT